MSASKRAKAKRAASRKSIAAERTRRRRRSHADELNRLRSWLLPNERMFADVERHGNAKWSPAQLVWLVLCWSWSGERNVTDAFEAAADQCRRTGVEPMGSYTGMMQALVRWSGRLIDPMRAVVQQLAERIGGDFWRVDGWLPIAFDGSRDSAPRTAANEAALCAPNYGRGKTARYRRKKSKGLRRKRNEAHATQPQEPQAWITLMWHMGLRLPWTWRPGPSNASERDHVQRMIDEEEFPENTLFCGDAGFVGYPLWSRIVEGGHDFLVRVGANVHLLAEEANCVLERPSDGRTVLCWPNDARRANRPALVLRLLEVRVGKTDMWLLTSVLDESRLTNAQCAELYAMRWGIEVEFRGLKQTLGHAGLRCREPRRLLVELDWSLLAMTIAELLALKEQLAANRPADDSPPNPVKRSLAKTIRALRWSLTHPEDVPRTGRDLRTKLRRAVTDDYRRRSSKRSRYRPPNPDKKPLGPPNLHPLSAPATAQLEALAPSKIAA